MSCCGGNNHGNNHEKSHMHQNNEKRDNTNYSLRLAIIIGVLIVTGIALYFLK